MKITNIIKLQNSLIESAEDPELVKALGTGYFISPTGAIYSFKAKTHEQWAEEFLGSTVDGLISQGWVRVRSFNHPSMNHTQGDGRRISDVQKVINVAEQDGKDKVIFWTKSNRIALIRSNGIWRDEDGKELNDILNPNRMWLDAKKKEYKDYKTSEFYYGEGGACGLVVFKDNVIIQIICRDEEGEKVFKSAQT